jgi:hypothetical protein
MPGVGWELALFFLIVLIAYVVLTNYETQINGWLSSTLN